MKLSVNLTKGTTQEQMKLPVNNPGANRAPREANKSCMALPLAESINSTVNRTL